MSLLELFCDVDDFCRKFEAWVQEKQLPTGRRCGPKPSLSASEIMTIIPQGFPLVMIHFRQAGYCDFKNYSQFHWYRHQ